MKTSTTLPYRGYAPHIEYSEEDGCYVGWVPGLDLHGISFEGGTEDEVRADFENAVDYYLESTENPEKPFQGFITLRVTAEMHSRLSDKARRAGSADLNAWLVRELSDSVLHNG